MPEKGVIQLRKLDRLYVAMMKRLGDKIVVNDVNNMVEQRRLEWTTYSYINLWFDTLKVFLVKKGFARHKILGEDHISGEQVYFEHQTHRTVRMIEMPHFHIIRKYDWFISQK